MKKYTAKVTAIVLAGLLAGSALAGCGAAGSANTSGTGTATNVSEVNVSEVTALFEEGTSGAAVSGDFSIVNEKGQAVTASDGVYTITAAGTYTITGELTNGQIRIDTDDEKVTLVLSGATLTNDGAVILAEAADKLTIEAASGTYNVITDTLATALGSEDEDNYDAAIWADCDLEIEGDGTLVVTSTANNGIKTKDDLRINTVNLKVTAYNNSLKGNDSITVESGNLLLVSETADGMKTSNSDVSSKGNQRGIISIEGGTVLIYSASDGIQAAYDVDISGEAQVSVYTADYASEAGASAAAAQTLYLVVPASAYSDAYDYYVWFYNDESGTFVKAIYETMIYGGRTASYYGLTVQVPTDYTSMQVVTFAAGADPETADYVALSDADTVNTSMNALVLSISGETISGDWTSLSSGSGSNKTTYSSKGIKAANTISISGGNITIYAMDDGLHANAGDALENDATGVGDINISGGTITITSADDGMHADGDLNLAGGTINVVDSHEGLEGNQILISDGTIVVYADDDGVNATSGSATPLVEVSGGYLDVTTPSGDTDGIDSNGNFVQTGGTIIVKSGAQMGGMAGSIDVDGSVSVTGGTIVALGGICELPSGSSVNGYAANGTNFPAGDYTLTDTSGKELLSFTLTSSYSAAWIASDELAAGTSYTLTQGGSTVLTWTQESGIMGSTGADMGGMGGFGGPGMGGGRRGR